MSCALAAEAVLSHKHDALGKNVVLVRCVDLTIATEEPSHGIVPVVDKKAISHEPFSVDIPQHYVACLKCYHQSIDEQLNTLQAFVQLDEKQCKLQVIPCQGNESIEDWPSHCKAVVDTFVESFTLDTLRISDDKKDIMCPVINTTAQTEKALHIKYTGGIVTIAGAQNDVSKIKERLDEACQAIVSETVPIDDEKFFLLLKAKLKYRALDDSLDIQASINADDHTITIMGFEEKCEEFKSKQLSHLQCVPVLLNNLFMQFLNTETGKTLLNYYLQSFRSEVVTYFDEAGRLFILGTPESQEAIDHLMQTIQSGLCCIHIVCPPSAQKILQDEKRWDAFCAKFESKQFVQIKFVKHLVKIIGDVRLSDPVKVQVERFIDSGQLPVKHFELCNAQWRVIQIYLNKKWQKLERKLRKEKQIQLVVPDMHDEDPLIIIEGEESKVEQAGEEIKELLVSVVTSTPIRQVRFDMAKYFFSEKGRTAIEHIEAEQKSCIHVTVDNESHVHQFTSSDTLGASVSECTPNSGGSPSGVKQQALLLQVFAVDRTKIERTNDCLQQLIKNHLFTDKIVDRTISHLTPKQCNAIKQKAKIRNVDITIELSKLHHYIELEGNLSDVIDVKHEIHSILHEYHTTNSMQRDIKNIQGKVKWQWQNESGVYEDYSTLTNYDIEQAYQSCQLQNTSFDMNDSQEQFDFKNMEAKNKKDNTIYKIKRSKAKFGKFYTRHCIPTCRQFNQRYY